MPKKHIVSCRLNDNDFNNVSNVARQLNIKKSDVIKLALDDNLGKYRPIKLTKSEKDSMEQNRRLSLDILGKMSTKCDVLINQWEHAGNNINQIAKRVNIEHKQGNHSSNTKYAVINGYSLINSLTKQNESLIKGLTKIWQSLE